MVLMVALMVIMVAVVLVGLKAIWKDDPTEPPGMAGHLFLRWPVPRHDVQA